MLRYGTIKEVDNDRALARVVFDDEMASDWLPVLVSKAASDSYFFAPETGEFVACLMDDQSENGVILGAIYNDKTKPKESGAGVASVVFSDGTKVVYDRTAKELSVETTGDIKLKAKTVTISGKLEVSGDVVAGVTVPGAPVVSLLKHIHPAPNTPPTPTP